MSVQFEKVGLQSSLSREKSNYLKQKYEKISRRRTFTDSVNEAMWLTVEGAMSPKKETDSDRLPAFTAAIASVHHNFDTLQAAWLMRETIHGDETCPLSYRFSVFHKKGLTAAAKLAELPCEAPAYEDEYQDITIVSEDEMVVKHALNEHGELKVIEHIIPIN